MKNTHLKHLVELNIAMMFVSTSGVLGKFIAMPPPLTIWWRSFLTIFCLGAYIWYKKINLKVHSKRDLTTILISGFFMGAHWITYFYALKLSGVAIGMLAMFTYPIITVFLEPIFFKTKLDLKHVFLGGLVLVGIYFLTPELTIENNVSLGVLSGIVSAVFYSIRNILMKKKTSNYHGSMLMFYQMIVITILLVPVFFIFEANPSTNDWLGLAALALFTTAIGHTLFVLSMKHFSIGTISIISSIQPIYGILFGMLFLSEIPASKTIIGGFLILSTVVIESYYSHKNR
ncbi:Threonine/homoserine efflux transporter RhtA [Lutibacter agarilyticus]|uniref:Threonine/homoserine efflux transporter RhtA n=1 Tax=Lutibacter agarilyticus TaxID=1109740 RepID=A0A238W016_9FLAO|nr:DMT family transporter [Lutibacter agarilyticus]SNR39483.1 Threonine/homoserine efflux transporter RhtA [Lutibacter agarilyticus]